MAIFNSYIKLPEGRSCKVWTKPSKLWSSCGKVCIRAIAKPLEQRDAPSNQHGFLWIYGIRNTPNIQCQNMSKSSCSPPFSPIFARNSIWVSEIPSPWPCFFTTPKAPPPGCPSRRHRRLRISSPPSLSCRPSWWSNWADPLRGFEISTLESHGEIIATTTRFFVFFEGL